MGSATAAGLVTVRLYPTVQPLAAETLVAELDEAAVRQIRESVLVMRAREQSPVTVELRYVDDARARTLLAPLDDLAIHGVRVIASPLAAPARPAAAAPAATAAPPIRDAAFETDPFGLDPAFRDHFIPPLRLLFERYWRVEVSGIEHVPSSGPALIAANHSGAVPADAFMLAMALDLRHPTPRPLRVLYDKFVDVLPFVGTLYNRLGGVRASFHNAELLLRRGEIVGLFPEGIAGLEKPWNERYVLRPFKSGTARLSVRTGSPIVPVAIVGAEEAYPVVARLYRAGRLVGVPWIPITPLFPLCGLAGALPLPTKWHMRFLPPVEPVDLDDRSEEEAVQVLTARVRAAINAALTAMLAERRCLFA